MVKQLLTAIILCAAVYYAPRIIPDLTPNGITRILTGVTGLFLFAVLAMLIRASETAGNARKGFARRGNPHPSTQPPPAPITRTELAARRRRQALRDNRKPNL